MLLITIKVETLSQIVFGKARNLIAILSIRQVHQDIVMKDSNRITDKYFYDNICSLYNS